MRVDVNQRPKNPTKRNMYAVLLGLTLVAIGLMLYDQTDFQLFPTRRNVPEAPPQLTVAPWKDMLQLRWNPSAEVLREASGGELLIRDGAATSRIPLPAAAIRRGNVVYAPHTDDVGFEMHTFGTRPQIASVRFLGAVTEQAAAGKPEPFGTVAQTGTADRAMPPRAHAAVAQEPDPLPPPPQPAAPAHRGVFGRMKHGLAKLWPVHHNSDDGGQR